MINRGFMSYNLTFTETEVAKESDHLNETIEDPTSLDSLISELEKTEATNSAHTVPPKPTMQKESVFVKLANRIKVAFQELKGFLQTVQWALQPFYILLS